MKELDNMRTSESKNENIFFRSNDNGCFFVWQQSGKRRTGHIMHGRNLLYRRTLGGAYTMRNKIIFLALLFLFCFGAINSAYAGNMDVISWGQKDSRWGSIELGTSGVNMSDYGCLVTAASMVANYYGSVKDPGQICTALNSSDGFDSDGYLYWGKIPQAAGGTISYVTSDASIDSIDSELDSGYPVIVQVVLTGYPHWVVITGHDEATYYINDPWYGDKTTLNSRYGGLLTAVKRVAVYHGHHSTGQHSDTAPTLNSPDENITIQSGTSTTFSWSNTGASRYKVRFINSSGGGTTDQNVEGTSIPFTPNYSGSWTWKVCEFPKDTSVEGTYSSERHFTVPGSTQPPTGSFHVDYFNSDNDFSSVIWTEDGLSNIDKNWGNGGPSNGVNNDCFGARFTSQINFSEGWYKFHYEVDDKIKIFIDNDCKVDKWGSHVLNEDSQPIYISGGTHTIKVEFADIGGEAKIKVNWFTTTAPTPTLQSIAITNPATKTSYTVGDTLDISGLVVTGTYSDGSTKTESVTAANISGFNSSAAANNQVLTITVGSMTTTYIVQIAALSVTLQSISITTPASKLIYTTGETLDISGLVVTGTYSNNTTATEPITFDNIIGFNSAVPVIDQVLTITVGGRTTNYKVMIVSPSATGIQLKDLPLGTVIKDRASWEHKTGNGYTGTGATKPVEWIIVAKNHMGYPANSVTLISKEIIGKYAFDDSTNREDSGGSNHWGNSGTPNATTGVRPWLNGTFYNHFSQNFKDAVLTTTVPNKVWGTGADYTTTDKIFLPSGTELGQGSVDWTYPIGTNWGYFSSDTARIASIGGNNWSYWDRSPRSVYSDIVCNVRFSGVFFLGAVAYKSDVGVRPALNLKSDIYVNLNGEVVGSEPVSALESIAITTPATKLSYTVGDSLDISGLIVTGTYSDGSTKTESVTAANITGFNSSAAVTNQVLTITVGEKTTTYTVTVNVAAINWGNYQYLTQWTPSSSSSEEMAYDSQGNIYVTNPIEQCVYKYTSSGSFISKFGSPGSGDGQFKKSLCGIAIDTQDNIYVADSLNNRIQKFTSNGVFITKGSGNLCYPKGLAIDSQGYIYAVSEWNNTIQKFTPDLALVKTWGSFGNGNGQFDYPDDIAIDSQDNVYVVDDYDGAHYGNCVQKFTTEGAFVAKWGSLGSGDGQFNHAEGIAVDGQGNVFVADLNNNRIVEYTANGIFISQWGSAGAGDGQFDRPNDIIFDKQGNVYVNEYGNYCRIQVFTLYDSTIVQQVATPVASAVGEVSAGTQVSLTTLTDGAIIYYTTDGSTPTTSSTVYNTAITITTAATVKAIAVKSGMNDSNVMTANYTVSAVLPGRPIISLGNINAAPGAAVDVPISISAPGGLAGYGLVIQYDPDMLTPAAVVKDGTATTGITYNPSYSSNEIMIAWSGSAAISSGGTLAIVTFTVKSSASGGTCSLVFDASNNYVNDIDTNAITSSFTFTDGSIKVVKYGDVNADGEINSGDATLVLRSYAKITTLTSIQLAAADVNGDGKVNSGDATLILRYYAKLISSFPVQQGGL